MPIDINLLRKDKGGDPDAVRDMLKGLLWGRLAFYGRSQERRATGSSKATNFSGQY